MVTSAETGRAQRQGWVGWPVSLSASLATVVAVLTVLFAAMARAGDNPVSFLERRLPPWLTVVGLVVVAVLVIAVWAARIHHPAVSIGLAVATTGSLLPLWAAWSWLPASSRAAVLATSPLTVPGVAQIALRWSADALPRRLVSVAVVYVVAGAGSLVHLLGYNPFADPGCVRTCDDVAPTLAGLVSTRVAVIATSVLAISAASVAAVVVLGMRRRGTPPPLVVAVLTTLGGLALLAGIRIASWGDATTSAWLVALVPVLVAPVAVVLCAVAVRTLRTRSALERLVSRLAGSPTALDHLGGAIQEVQFALPDDLRWIDALGRDVREVPPPDRCILLTDDSGPSVRLVTRHAHDVEVLAAITTPATRLALKNAQLSAVAKARLADVQASQRRVVARSDAERRRIERDLHDGAQQRLVSAALHLQVAVADADPTTARRLRRAEARIREALSHLRRLAHGVFPSVLTSEGLEAALDDLVAGSDVPTRLDVDLPHEVSPEAAMAGYAVVAAALGHVLAPTSNTVARISAAQDDDALTVVADVTAGGGTVGEPDFTDVADRVGAVGGRFVQSVREDGGIMLTAVIPCGS